MTSFKLVAKHSIKSNTCGWRSSGKVGTQYKKWIYTSTTDLKKYRTDKNDYCNIDGFDLFLYENINGNWNLLVEGSPQDIIMFINSM